MGASPWSVLIIITAGPPATFRQTVCSGSLQSYVLWVLSLSIRSHINSLTHLLCCLPLSLYPFGWQLAGGDFVLPSIELAPVKAFQHVFSRR
jgi:hypothetical protein